MVHHDADGSLVAEHYIKDHLGNIRVAYTLNSIGTGLITRQIDNYYPFGMNIRELTASLGASDRPNEYLYNGKMFQDEMGLNWLDYGARFYDAVLGRWHVPDAFAERACSQSPYRYGLNNPISFFDPDGNLESTHTDEDGNVVAVKNDGDNGAYKHNGKEEEAKKEVDKNYSTKNTGAGGDKMGETQYWDEFAAIDDKTGKSFEKPMEGSRIIFGDSWDNLISNLHDESLGMSLFSVANSSRGYHHFDIKTNSDWSPFREGTGKKLNGYYASARSAGNYLAGLNGSGRGLTFENYMEKAGAYHKGQKFGLVTNLFGNSFGSYPWYGENQYCGRMVVNGWLNNPKANDVNFVLDIYQSYCK